MASGIIPFRPVTVRAEFASTDSRKPARTRKASSPKWRSPIFGFSQQESSNAVEKNISAAPEADGDRKPETNRFAPGTFTEEKARQLRRMTFDAASFHDTMYHSAIASALASDFSDRTAAA